MDTMEKIDAKIAELKALVMDKIKTGKEEDVGEFTRYLGIVEGLAMAKKIMEESVDDGK